MANAVISTETVAQASTPQAIARAIGDEPLFLVQSTTGEGLAAAKWRFEANRSFGETYPANILVYRAAGSASVTRICGGRAIRKRPRIGSVTFVGSDSGARWVFDDVVEAVHVYLPDTRIQSFARQHLDAAPATKIDDFFAIEDPWLRGYFQMLLSELDSSDARRQPADTLLLEQTEHVVLRHLVRWHSNATVHDVNGLDAGAKVNALRPVLLHRIEDYVHANLTRDISLADLARLCNMSVDHFLRTFRAATGITPYRYVLEQRLRRAAVLLKSTENPIAAIAATCGFGGASNFSVKFHARFGASPTEFRRNASD
jgi:AraC family transcriptional regulator